MQISPKLAKLAKKHGFDERCHFYFHKDELIQTDPLGSLLYVKYDDFIQPTKGIYLAPEQHELANWFREKHQMIITVLPFRDVEVSKDISYYFVCVDLSDLTINDDILCNEDHLGASDRNYKTYEKAFEQGLLYAFKLLKL